MLVLSRRKQERCIISLDKGTLQRLLADRLASVANDARVIVNAGGDVQISVLVIDNRDKVRLGFDAPECVTIHREEVYKATQREKASANQSE